MPPLASKFHDWFLKTSIPDKYGLYASLLLAAWLAYWLGRRCTCWVLEVPQVSMQLQRLAEFPVPEILRWMDISSYIQCLVVIVLVTANALTVGLHTTSWTDVQKRSGSLAIIHLLPLCSGFTFSLPADACHVSRRTFSWIHRWIGRICVLHCLLHGTVIINKNHISALTSGVHAITLVAWCCLLVIPPLTYGAILRRHTQLILKAHYILAVVAVGALAYHLIEEESLYRWVLLCGVCLWLSLSGIVWIQTVWSLKPWHHRRRDTVVSLYNRLLWIDITVPPCWKIRPGQYVQLWMPHSGIQTCLHLPLFYVTSIEDTELQTSARKNKDLGTNSRDIYTTDSEGDEKRKLGANRVRTLHIVTRPRVGLTGRLAQRALGEQGSSMKLPVYVMGPYGYPHCFDKYGTIMFIVEDIGLFRVLPFIQNLVQGSRDRKNTVRKLEVLWQVKISDFDHPHWVQDQLQKILDLDRRDQSESRDAPERHGFDILHFKIYLLGTRPGDQVFFSNRTRLSYYFCPISPTNEIIRYMKIRCGKMAVAVCANSSIREMVKKEARPRVNKDFRLIEFELEPSTEWLSSEVAITNMQHTRAGRDNPVLAKITSAGSACRNDDEESSERASIWSGRTLPCDGHANAIPDNASMLSGSTLVSDTPEVDEVPTIRISDNEHTKWVKQKIAEGRRDARRN